MSQHLLATVLLVVGAAAPAAEAPAAPTSPAPGALAWEPIPSGRRAPLPKPAPGEGFQPLNPATLGIHWTNQLSSARYATRQNLMNGAGVALADIDDDGWADLFLCNKEGPSALFRNLGHWRFTNITETAGVAATHLIATGAVFGDVNGDRRPDLLVTSFLGPDALFLNLGNGRFTNVTASAGVASKGGTTSAAMSDVDGDGDLDLYVAHFGIEAILRDGAVITTRNVGGQPVVMGRFSRRLKIQDGRMVELGEPDVLYLNDGQGRFTPAPAGTFTDETGQSLSELPPDFGLCVQIRDLDGNGTPDIYVCNDFQTPDRIWLGDGRGRFRAAPPLAFRNMSYASMGVDCADLDRDGRLEIFTVEMLSRDHVRNLSQRSPMDPTPRKPGLGPEREAFPRNVLQWNRGDGSYAEIAWFAGVAMSDWSWSPVFLDVDLDGFEDLLVSNGHMHDVNDMDVNATRSRDPAQRAQETARQILLAYPSLRTPNGAWRNRGNLTFEDKADAWRFNATAITHGTALADLDNDGDLDVVGNVWSEPPIICRNEASAPRVAVRLRGPSGNPHGIGSRVRLLGGPVAIQEQELHAGGRYLSSDHPQLTFAAGTGTKLSLEVRWPGGRVSVIPGVVAGYLYEVAQEDSTPAPAPPAPTADPSTFSEITLPQPILHTESDFDDFARQALLPRRLSRLGPGLVAFPLGEGVEVYMGGSRGGTLAGIRIDRQGPPKPVPVPATGPLPDDTTGLLAVELTPGKTSLLIALASLETTDPGQPAVLRFDREGEAWRRGADLPPDGSSPGTLIAGDLDRDGDADVVVAGRWIPGRYPEPASTRVFLNDQGRLVPDLSRSAALQKAGLVTGAALADINRDRFPDLVLACEWGPIRVFLGTGSGWKDATAALGFEAHSGLWQSVAIADFDGDGRPDIAAGNWGRNSMHQRAPAGPWELTYGDFDGDGRVSVVEGYFHPGLKGIVPLRPRDTLAGELPWLAARFPRNRDYATALVSQLLEGHAAQSTSVRASTLASAVFLNREDRFEHRELPAAAQWSPLAGLAAADFDGNGTIDLAGAQNLFALRDEDDRLDAGRGLLLSNEGQGRFSARESLQSGLQMTGEQRAVLATDLDLDGHPDLAVSQNGGPLRLWRNQAPAPRAGLTPH